MKHLIEQYEQLQAQASTVYNQITAVLDPYRIDDCHYKNGNIEVIVDWRFDGDYTVYCGTQYYSGYSNPGDVEVWEVIWNYLNGIEVIQPEF